MSFRLRAAGAARARAACRALACALVAFGLVSAGSNGIDEYQLKAAFLSKFVKYVTWPSERLGREDQPFVVGVLGSDPFGAKLDEAFRDRKLGAHPIEVQRFADTRDASAAHLLFVPACRPERLEEIVQASHGASVLLVGEHAEFATRGGVINFYVEGEKLRFEINTESAKRQKLRISSDLLKLARIVTDQE